MEEKKKKKKQKHQHPNGQTPKSAAEFSFKPSSEVKGLRFGGQFIVKSFTIRRAKPPELVKLLDFPPFPNKSSSNNNVPFPSTTAFLPTNFTILAHQAWHTLTLGLGTRKSKVLFFVFESETMKVAVDGIWPTEIPLGEVNKRLIRGLKGCEMARFKFRKGCLTFYVYAVRGNGNLGFVAPMS
ncbi:dolichyl-phosphate beta-glucosyltransferase-like isoform X1 [Hibiscus syriacus]|uniref:Dolichyl-phosphate beta-glucosyltransferase-like isoform X1 n=1 Tax=Hibiscus syriacus TaxID=106335 RepID=A0A6A2XXZ9_HIBSY|nr:dolichyl-phosphate beta-glucosyltransferase-like isoform X1 [Hibiscus syriacus]